MGREQSQRIREWARANGYNPSSRGSISQDIRRAYDAAGA
ncbi:Lsr2 family DNA-binding protein [Arthrobacter humicola]